MWKCLAWNESRLRREKVIALEAYSQLNHGMIFRSSLRNGVRTSWCWLLWLTRVKLEQMQPLIISKRRSKSNYLTPYLSWSPSLICPRPFSSYLVLLAPRNQRHLVRNLNQYQYTKIAAFVANSDTLIMFPRGQLYTSENSSAGGGRFHMQSLVSFDSREVSRVFL